MKKPIALEVGKKYLTRNGCVATCVYAGTCTAQCVVKTKHRKWASRAARRRHRSGAYQERIGGWYYTIDGACFGEARTFKLTIVKEKK